MKKNKFDISWRQKTLEVLENNKWLDEKEYPTGLVRRCYEYRKIPVGKLTVGELRTLIGQNIGLKYLIPIAIEFLATDVLIEGDLYSGDLLESVLKIDKNFWTQNLNLKEQIIDLINLNGDKIKSENLDLDNFVAMNS
ncbi:MAG: hypothetical protein K0S33_3852 [Bacteroidetes bacterium]|jgi:hypothetical protein|nr:hypothetical protein [Bacteroidota bacterium]